MVNLLVVLLLVQTIFVTSNQALAAVASVPARVSRIEGLTGFGESIGMSPFWNWQEIETQHFRIIFPAELKETAEKVANHYEDAHEAMSKKLYWEAYYKVPVVLLDNADAANGLTTPVGRFGMALFVTPPDNWFSTAYYDDWLKLLCFHEYTHFLNIDATRGGWGILRTLIGDLPLPNSVWPNWMLEGLAVYMETRFTRGGRGRSPYYEMILRSAVEAGVLDTDKFFTIDRFDSLNVPYYPGGEAIYLFGYELMNVVASNNKDGDDALGVMSYRSSYRVPYLINGNLENITGRDWYSYWDQFIKETRDRTTKELSLIKAKPVTITHKLTSGGYDVMGSVFSADGKWLAYSGGTLDQRYGLYLRDLKTGETKRVADKTYGAHISFTPDSRFLVFSSLRRESEYYQFSELGAYNLKTGEINWMTAKLRARDPNISHDGRNIVFTVAIEGTTALAIANLKEKNGRLECTEVQVLNPSEAQKLGDSFKKYDALSSPKFSKDDQSIVFSLHSNGRTSEELMVIDRRFEKLRTLVRNGSFNRHPTVMLSGDILFISDRTGVDNLYRLKDWGISNAGNTENAEPELLTNLTTGIAFPSVGQVGASSGANGEEKVYGAVYSYTGWDLAEIEVSQGVTPAAITIGARPAPNPELGFSRKDEDYPTHDYSIIPSIWPRAWTPYGALTLYGAYIGEAITGFDAIDEHRYWLNLGFDTLSAYPDWFLEYQNRTLGPTITVAAGNQLGFYSMANGVVSNFSRGQQLQASISYPILWTYASLTPSISLNLTRSSYFYTGSNTSTVNNNYTSQFIPSLDTVLNFSNTEQSKLAIAAEEGRSSTLGFRYYVDSRNQAQVVKGLLTDTGYIRLGDSHTVLVPSIQASYTSATVTANTNPNSAVILQGHFPTMAGTGFVGSSLTSLPIRGYPGMTFYVKSAIVSALDLRFPLGSVFRGWGTNPVYLDQFQGFSFFEATTLPIDILHRLILTSAGVGVKANLELFVQIPASISVEYHQGFQSSLGGTGELFVSFLYSGISF